MVGIFEKVAKIQQTCMGKTFKDETLDDLLPFIFEECYKENLMLYFTFIEDCALLKLKEWDGKGEINARMYYGNYAPLQLVHSKASIAQIDEIKTQLLKNTFLITNNNDVSSAEKETVIKESKSVPPKPIREAEEHIRKKGIPITKAALENYFKRYNPLKEMDPETRKFVLDYLKEMKK